MKAAVHQPPLPLLGDLNAADVGMNLGTPVSEDYAVPFRLSGKIERVTIDLGDRSEEDRIQSERAQSEGKLKRSLTTE